LPDLLSIAANRALIDAGGTTCLATTRAFLKNISQSKEINAYVQVFEDYAIERARLLDQKPKSERGRLFGTVLSIKDNICLRDQIASAGSKMLANHKALYTATVIQKLLDQDAIIIGRTNCDEFAMGSSNENSFYGPTKNPVNTTKVPGGSSGGAAASVKANLCHAAIGSSTGGSIRQPAAFCGVVGLKPTYGRTSRYGLIAYGSSLDQIGVLTHTVEDSALLLEIMAGHCQHDATASIRPVEAYNQSIKAAEKSKTIAYYVNCLEEGLSKEVKQATIEVLEKLKDAGYTLLPVKNEFVDYLVSTYYVLCTAEASSNLSRLDGVRYGYRTNETVTTIEEQFTKSRSEGLGIEVKRRIMLGSYVLSAGYYDAYYAKAQKVRRLIQQQINNILEQADVLFSPVSPFTAFTTGEKMEDPVSMYLADIFTVEANLAGLPAISLPLKDGSDSQMPVGFQFTGKAFQEKKLLNFSKNLISIFADQ